jgi:hypothetical protein
MFHWKHKATKGINIYILAYMHNTIKLIAERKV